MFGRSNESLRNLRQQPRASCMPPPAAAVTQNPYIIYKEAETMTKTIGIQGMMCAHCEARMKKALEEIDGVISAAPSHEQNNAVLELSKDVPDEKLRETVESAGYQFVG